MTTLAKKKRSLFGAQDMTTGSAFSCLAWFALPMLISNIAQQLYSTADASIVGRYLGDDALGAVGASMPIQNLFLVFLMAVGSGVTIMVSQYFGAKDKEKLGVSIGNALTLMIILSVIMTAVSVPLTGPILRLTKTSPQMYDMAYQYLFIMFCGTAASGFYNVMSGILRGLGDSIFPLIVLLGAVVINIGLDIWFVAPWGLDMGIAGAALATIASQIFSAVACTVRVLRMKQNFVINKESMKLQGPVVKQIVRLGLPTGVQMAVMFLSNIVMQPFIMAMTTPTVNVFAAMTATMRVDGFAVMPCQAFSMAVSTYTGQNIGAGKLDRLKKGSTTTLVMSMGFSLIMVAAMLIWGPYVFSLFTETPELIAMSMGFIRVMIPAYIVMSVNMTFNGIMRGAGDSIGTMVISLLINVFLKIPITLVLIYGSKSEMYPNGHPNSMMQGMVICMAIGCVITLIYYKVGKWRDKAVVRAMPTKA